MRFVMWVLCVWLLTACSFLQEEHQATAVQRVTAVSEVHPDTAVSDKDTQKAVAQPVVVCKGKLRSRTYTVKGKQYTTLCNADGFQQSGTASWYGPYFHGRLTASGQRYNMYHLTAAHKRLPFGTKVEVLNMANGKKVVVVINDRGPYYGDRIIDLSKAAARKLDMLKTGTAQVKLRAL